MRALDNTVVHAVWTALQGHLPPPPPDTHPLGCHRPRVPDRICFTAILTRLVTGCSWHVAAYLTGGVSATTLRARRTEWLTAGVFDKLVTEALAAYDRIIGLDLSEVAVDGSRLAHRNKMTAYTGRVLSGSVRRTVLAGGTVFDGHDLAEPSGRLLARAG